jgi:hypothetical protein
MKLLSKERIGSKTIKRHASPKTPYQRILLSPLISSSVKQTLTKQFETLNPFVLRETMERKLGRIYSTHTPDHPVTLTIPSGNILL